ncbi:hypothetical protein [Roseovarius sp. Pro17]|uniref:hypothetical protein n=1 Tax=Roseovarius sp. Pro17 TaxID=3108175 RepID=UPI002D77CAFC|nr:hypothetical protein [Roseovarius sp. Pro17]
MRLTPLRSQKVVLTEAEVDKVIARTLFEERQVVARAALPAIASQEELSGHSGRNARRSALEDSAAAARLDAVAAQHNPPPPQVEDLTGRNPRITAQRVLWLCRRTLPFAALGAMWAWPWLLPAALVAAIVLPLGCVIALGSDGVANALTRAFHWTNARWPDRAERLRRRMDRFATRMDGVLDRLPERWTIGLYMPDFSREALLPHEDAGAPDPFERLRAEARGV